MSILYVISTPTGVVARTLDVLNKAKNKADI